MATPTEFPVSTAEQPALAGLAFGVGSAHVKALDSAIARLEAAELLARRAEAERVAALAEVDLVARLEAAAELGARARVRAAEDSLAYRAARAEAATALHLSEQSTAYHLAQAATLVSTYAATIAVLESGKISRGHAVVILDAGSVIGPAQLREGAAFDTGPGALDPVLLAAVAANRAAYETQVLAEAVKTTPHLLRPIARRIAERYALEDLDSRHKRARTLRSVWMTLRDEGMAEIGALLPAHEATAVLSRLTFMAKRVAQAEAREQQETPSLGAPRRTRSEIKADLFADLLLNGTRDTATGGAGSGTGIAGIIQLVTDEEHLRDTAPGDGAAAHPSDPDRPMLPELEGYGPVPVGMARDIAAADGVWSKVNVDLRTGNVLTVETYRPSEQIRRFLAARDQRCRFPGCRVPVHRCDFDHTVDAALGGPTSTNNLGALCRGHHIVKHHSGWNTNQRDNGDYEWTSPTGRPTSTSRSAECGFHKFRIWGARGQLRPLRVSRRACTPSSHGVPCKLKPDAGGPSEQEPGEQEPDYCTVKTPVAPRSASAMKRDTNG